MQAAGRETAMIHFECGVCGMAATLVDTPTGSLAWLDHMENHAQKKHYRAWTWTAVQLDLEG